jgi:hypothetical protein
MIRRLVASALLALLIPGLLATCSGCGTRRSAARVPRTAEDSLADWRGRADSLESTLGSLEMVKGQFIQGTGPSVYAAWFDSGRVRVVHEEVSLGNLGSRSNRYYFERDVPRLAIETGMVPTDTTLRIVPFDSALLFDDFGRLVAATKALDGVKTWIASYEAATTLEHARLLWLNARDARSSRGAAAPPEGGTPTTR